jgi:hypothetical protein
MLCRVFGIRREAQPVYEILYQEGNKELRQYRAYLVATTWHAGDYASASNAGFRRLFHYISGHNHSQHKLAMTAPVLQQNVPTGDTITMTAPVLQAQEQQGWSMSFVMPARSTMDTLPRPLDDTITLHEVPAASVAVWCYSWGTSAEKITRLGRALLRWIATQKGYEVVSQPRSARYNPPFTLPFLRRNEIHADVRAKSA